MTITATLVQQYSTVHYYNKKYIHVVTMLPCYRYTAIHEERLWFKNVIKYSVGVVDLFLESFGCSGRGTFITRSVIKKNGDRFPNAVQYI